MLFCLANVTLDDIQILKLTNLKQSTLLGFLNLELFPVVIVDQIAELCLFFLDCFILILELEESLGFELVDTDSSAVRIDVTERHLVVELI